MRPLVPRLLLTAALLVLTACPTLDFRRVQSDFNAAVQADNAVSVAASPLADPTSEYDQVIADLPDTTIERLDVRLRANAYLIRGIAQWRRGDVKASSSAESGRAAHDVAGTKGSRDDILLAMLPGLSVHDRRVAAWLEGGESPSPSSFKTEYTDPFTSAWTAFEDAASRTTPGTPPGVLAFLAYQRWRLVANWSIVIESLPTNERLTASDAALLGIGASESSLNDAMDRLEKKVPEGHPLRSLIRLQSR